MKFLIVSVLVLGACLAQPQRRPQSYYDNNNNQDQQQNTAQSYQDNQYQQNSVQDTQRDNQESTQYHEPKEKEVIKFIPIIRFDKEQSEDGSYKAAYETGNNIISEEEGYLKDLGPDPEEAGKFIKSQVQLGHFIYTSPEGKVIETKYTADENGFHATGDHLPTPPPVSPEVQKGLDLIYAGIKAQQEADALRIQEHPELRDRPERYDDGQYRQEEQ